MKPTRLPEEYRRAVWAATCSVEEAVRWLETRPVKHSPTGPIETPTTAHLPEYLLLRRREPAIDLALAAGGRSRSVLDRIWNRSGDAMRVVLAGNPSLHLGAALGGSLRAPGQLLGEIMRQGPSAQLRALCAIPDLRSDFYATMIHAWQPARDEAENSISEERFREILVYLADNPRTRLAREDSHERHFLDGYADHQYNLFFANAWELAEKVEPSEAWAAALAQLYRRLHHPYNPFDDVEPVIARWRKADEDEYAASQSVREALAAAFLQPSVEMARSDDPALRRAFYRSFGPDTREFRDLDWGEFLGRDEYCYWHLWENLRIWRSATGRRKLEQLHCDASEKDSDVGPMGVFNEMEERYSSEHPEWFTEPEDEVAVFETIEAYNEALPQQKAEPVEGYRAREEEARGRYDDFDQVAYNPNLPITAAMAETIHSSEIGPDMAYYLGVNPKEADRISKLSPVVQAEEIGRLEAKLLVEPATKRVSRAPEPISGGGEPDKIDLLRVEVVRLTDRMTAERVRTWLVAAVFVVGLLLGRWLR